MELNWHKHVNVFLPWLLMRSVALWILCMNRVLETCISFRTMVEVIHYQYNFSHIGV
jgi:hypothetical protein